MVPFAIMQIDAIGAFRGVGNSRSIGFGILIGTWFNNLVMYIRVTTEISSINWKLVEGFVFEDNE